MDKPVDKSLEIKSDAAKEEWPSRPQRRFLRRIYNGRSVPIVADGREFLTYKAALAFLLTLDLAEREACYAAMKAQAQSQREASRAD